MVVHVLEHFNAPGQALSQIREMLREGGLLYVEVPNFGLPHALPAKLFHYAHIYNFTVKTLRMLGQSRGFRVRDVLSDAKDKNLRILFEKSASSDWDLDPTSYAFSCQAVRRYNWLTYHARWSYLATRASTLLQRFGERRQADAELQRILELCRTGADGVSRKAA